ncbi:MerR family transcriptional regulator [Duganella aceris]
MDGSNSKPAGYRSGVAARMAGLPVETLRVWERRYGVSDAGRSPHGQRLYSADQVRRLNLIKRVVDLGHAIGTVAQLSETQLRDLAGTAQPVQEAMPRQLRIAVAGAALARRLAAITTMPELDIVAHCPQLHGAATALMGAEAEVLLIEETEMTSDALPLILAAQRATQIAAVVVMYRFCDSATVRRLREHGYLVARVPADAAEIAMLCGTALAGAGRPLPLPPPAPRRRLDDQALAALAAASTTINCECPRHLSDILIMLGSFERYSLQCASRNASDAALHQELNRSAGMARAIMEQALERLALAEGLPLPTTLAEQ